MSTRLRRPSIWRGLLVTTGLLAFQGYLGWNAVVGKFGIESQKEMKADIVDFKVQSAALQAEIDAYRHKVDLFNPHRLDPDILTERARALLSMAHIGDMVVMVDPETGKPVPGSIVTSTENGVMPRIEVGID